ncbi:transketolase [Rhodoglobus vestalii]|uniref:Transketolase n=1 Tax=Rhodoglobus vestalii TaxID=193384 RepID=A0A8H2KCI2_9MICO|nr:1-deoxy-D-xylulose-5-phosphate synthase N-terminal domain-containing protein [Rhodoglobus vestalii]TQO20686.1 transketolase [Rhodoglobus vestalii]
MSHTSTVDTTEIERIAAGIRRRVLEHTLTNNGGYMSQACSAAELLGCLYGGMVDLAPLPAPLIPPAFPGTPGPNGINRRSGADFHGPTSPSADRLVSSPAHYALVIYAALIETGRLDENALDDFNRDGGTVEMIGAEHSPGFETTTGSLAQAISQAGGIALARRLKNETGRTWVFMSDGEFQEGQTWEALNAASFYKLSKLRVIVDVNGGQCDGPMDTVMGIEPLAERIAAFGWNVHSVDGHSIEAILEAGADENDKPTMILCYTDPVRGLPILEERRPVLHYLRFTGEEEQARYQAALEEMSR